MLRNAVALVLLVALPGAFASYCAPNGSPCPIFGSCCGVCSYNKCVAKGFPTFPVPAPQRCVPDGVGCSFQPGVPCCNGGFCQNDRCVVPVVQPPVVPPPVVPPPVVTPPPVLPPPVDFTNCQCKKPTSLTLRYIGSGSVTLDLNDVGGKSSGKKKKSKKSKKSKKKSARRGFFPTPGGSSGIITVNSGETFTVQGPFKSATTIGNAEIHTSCSDALGIGQTFCGTFELVAGTNDKGTSLCPETRPQRKGKCF